MGAQNPYQVAGPGDESVHGRFAEVVRDRPEATAISARTGRLTYAELDALTDRMAARLAELGVRPDQPVGVLLDRSVHLVCALLAVVKAGGAYLALDPRDPPERVARLLHDAGVGVLVTDPAHAGWAHADVAVLSAPAVLDAAAGPPVPGRGPDPDRLAYVAYTSGSTGRPKAVGVPHRAVHRLVVGTDVATIGPDDVFFQYAPAAFDASTLEIWGALLNGATLVVPPPGELTPIELADAARRSGVTVLWLTAGLFHQFVDARPDPLPDLRYLIAGGDVLSPDHVDRCRALLPAVTVVNGYGPTESTTFTCCHPVREPLRGAAVPIGTPVAGRGVRVLDDNLRPVPDGEVGVLHATGAGLARGYLGRPDLTAERFRPDPYAAHPGARMYDTGDLVRRRPDGTVEFVGRVDDQVKIRGFRVEPAEVEAELRRQPEVRNAAVVATGTAGGGRNLVAFCEGGRAVPSVEMRRRLAERLPSYLVPADFRWLLALPLTGNGKVDRSALAAGPRRRPDVDSDYRPPAEGVERWLTDRWQESLDIDRVGVDDDFFELGGHSLIATRITGAIADEYGVLVRARVFYENPTVAELAGQVEALVRVGSGSPGTAAP